MAADFSNNWHTPHFLVLVLYFVISAIAVGSSLSLFNGLLNTTWFVGEQKTVPSTQQLPPQPIPAAEPSTKPDFTTELRYQWALEYQGVSPNEVVMMTCANCSQELVRWKNLLFYQYDGSDQKRKDDYLFVLNLATREKSVLLDKQRLITLIGSEEKDSRLPGWVSDLQLIGDSLYVGMGGYLEDAKIIAIELPSMDMRLVPTDKLMSPSIKHWLDREWIVSSFGDGCGGFATYYLFDPQTDATRKIVSSNTGCMSGPEIVGVDTRNRFIIADKSDKLMDEKLAAPEDLAAFGPPNVYVSVKRVSIDNPDQPEILVSENDMPKNIIKIYLDEQKDRLILTGPEGQYAANLDTHQVVPTAVDLTELTPFVWPFENKSVDQIINELVLPDEFAFTRVPLE